MPVETKLIEEIIELLGRTDVVLEVGEGGVRDGETWIAKHHILRVYDGTGSDQRPIALAELSIDDVTALVQRLLDDSLRVPDVLGRVVTEHFGLNAPN